MGLRLCLCLVHGANRGVVIGGLNGLGIRLERRLCIRLESGFGRLLVKLSITEDLERFDYNVSCVAFLAILVIPRAVGEGSFDEEGHALVDTEGFDDICRFSPCYEVMPVCLFLLFAVRVSVSSCGCKGEGGTFAARLGDSEFGVSSCISYEEDFIEVSHILLFLLLLMFLVAMEVFTAFEADVAFGVNEGCIGTSRQQVHTVYSGKTP